MESFGKSENRRFKHRSEKMLNRHTTRAKKVSKYSKLSWIIRPAIEYGQTEICHQPTNFQGNFHILSRCLIDTYNPPPPHIPNTSPPYGGELHRRWGYEKGNTSPTKCSTLDKARPGFWETESLRPVTLGYCS